MIDVQEAVGAVRDFINNLYGPNQLQFTVLEEVEYLEDIDEWRITMTLGSPASILGKSDKSSQMKVFRVDGDTADVISMKIRS